ncbi:MAG TPA: cupin domain-containing protein [Acidimicrobiales bacterium]|nr:cupin domain-containing protein [Acidimicrobiales bacterium]
MSGGSRTDGKRFVDVTGQEPPGEPDYWDPVVFSGEEIESEARRLASLPAPADGRRQSLFVHPRSAPDSPSLAPGIRVTLAVLRPGERTRPIRHNSTVVSFCIDGGGHAVVDGQRIDFARYDAWNVPSHRPYWIENDGDDLAAMLVYSNAPVLEKLNVHLVEDNPAEEPVVAPEPEAGDESDRAASPFGTFQLNATGAHLMPYEVLINPPAVESRPLHWAWSDVKDHLDRLDALGSDYVGRRLYLLYNPATGRTNGTTPSFFATITIRPPGIVDRPHRHVSAAINYFFHGRGWSRIAGRRYEWKAGDLMLTAPGWAIHHHASHDGDRVYELTVQDQPFHIGNESLLWQEDLRRPPRVLGSEAGFATNR